MAKNDNALLYQVPEGLQEIDYPVAPNTCAGTGEPIEIDETTGIP